MIHTKPKRYQLVLWATEDRGGLEPALRLEFDLLEEAQAAFEEQQTAGSYRSGILMVWRKNSGIWDLLDQYPNGGAEAFE
jgi:hypothetical protein